MRDDHLTTDTTGVLAGAVRLDAGDSAVVLEFGSVIERRLLDRVSALDRVVRALADAGRLPGLVETVPTFRSLALLFDPLSTTPDTLIGTIGDASDLVADVGTSDGRDWLLPVLYGGEHGPDLKDVAKLTQLDPDEVIRQHTAVPLVSYMLGFLPGFAFLGDIAATLRLPRRDNPRVRVPAGSVAIANSLSAVYPWQSPGGWHLLGHCPVPLFSAERDEPALIRAADRVVFRRIESDEHVHLVTEREAGRLDTNDFLNTGTGLPESVFAT